MERVKVQFKFTFSFHTIIPLRITDLNYGGHVGNDSFLSLAHEARAQFLHSFGVSEMNFYGTSLIMADCEIEFKTELRYPQEVRVSVAAGGVDRIGFDFYYLLETQSSNQWIVAGKIKTGMVCYDYKSNKRGSVPAAATNLFSK